MESMGELIKAQKRRAWGQERRRTKKERGLESVTISWQAREQKRSNHLSIDLFYPSIHLYTHIFTQVYKHTCISKYLCIIHMNLCIYIFTHAHHVSSIRTHHLLACTAESLCKRASGVLETSREPADAKVSGHVPALCIPARRSACTRGKGETQRKKRGRKARWKRRDTKGKTWSFRKARRKERMREEQETW